MTALRLRESPRLIAAGVVLAVVLLLIGVLVGSATSGASSSGSSLASLRQRDARQAGQLRGAVQMLATLRAQLGAATQSLALTRGQLATARDRARCWRRAALHRGATRVSNCAVRITTKGR